MIGIFSKEQLLHASEDKFGWREIEQSKDKFKIYRTENEIHISFKSMHEFNISFFEYAYFYGRVIEETDYKIKMDWKIKIPLFNMIGFAFFVFVSILEVIESDFNSNVVLWTMVAFLIVAFNVFFILKKIRKSVANLQKNAVPASTSGNG